MPISHKETSSLDTLQGKTASVIAEVNKQLDKTTREQLIKSGQSIYHMAVVLKDEKSNPIEQATAVLTCLSNLSQVAAAAGGGPIAGGVSTLVNLVIQVLGFFAGRKPAPSVSEQVDKVIREVLLEQYGAKLKSAKTAFTTHLSNLKDVHSNSQTGAELHQKAGFSSGAELTLFEVGYWLAEENNFEAEPWEDVFALYAEVVIQDITLRLVAVDRASTTPEKGDVPKITARRNLGIIATDLQKVLKAVQKRLLQCGDYYAAGGIGGKPQLFHLDGPANLIKWLETNDNGWGEPIHDYEVSHIYWRDNNRAYTNRGSCLAVHPRTGRFWANGPYGLSGGWANDWHLLWESFCTDIGLFAGEHPNSLDRLLLTTPDGKLWVTDWDEAAGHKGKLNPWTTSFAGAGNVVMARGFRPIARETNASEEYICVLRSHRIGEGKVQVKLQILSWKDLLEGKDGKVDPDETLWEGEAGVEWWNNSGWQYELPLCRIAVSKRYLYLVWSTQDPSSKMLVPQFRRAAFDTLLLKSQPGRWLPNWETLPVPTFPVSTGQAGALALYSLETLSDDAVVSVSWLGDPHNRGWSKNVVSLGYHDGDAWEWQAMGGNCSHVVRKSHESWRMFEELREAADLFAPWASLSAPR